jgi:Galactose oxidase, central domain
MSGKAKQLLVCFLGAMFLSLLLVGTAIFAQATANKTAGIACKKTTSRSGSVLLAGGDCNTCSPGPTATAELYNPTTKTFTATRGSMTASRAEHTATLLTERGQVLITGGIDNTSMYLASAEIYDSHKQAFIPTKGTMSAPRIFHKAVLLPNGLVLITGGTSLNQALNTAELYNAKSQTFTPTNTTMNSGRLLHTATLLASGNVLIAGGQSSNGAMPLSSAEVYHSKKQQFVFTNGDMTIARYGHTATLLNNGKVLITGGFGSGGCPGAALATAEIFDSSSGTFAPTKGPMNNARALHSATLLRNGTVLIAGGIDADCAGDVIATAEIFDPATGLFTPTSGVMTSSRYRHTATRLNDGTVLIAGGENSSFTVLETAELYNPASKSFVSTSGTMTQSRISFTADAL